MQGNCDADNVRHLWQLSNLSVVGKAQARLVTSQEGVSGCSGDRRIIE